MSNNNSIYEEEYRGYKIIIEQDDDDPMNPREWDNLGTFISCHRKWVLGDKTITNRTFNEIISDILFEDFGFSIIGKSDKQYLEMFKKYYFYLPVYIYDHGGISLSCVYTYPHDDMWDAGIVGFVYVKKSSVLKEYNKKLWTKKFEFHISRMLIDEIDTYSDYLNGNCFGYVVSKDDEEIESRWGFYPFKTKGNYYDHCLSEAKSVVEYLKQKEINNKWGEFSNREIENGK